MLFRNELNCILNITFWPTNFFIRKKLQHKFETICCHFSIGTLNNAEFDQKNCGLRLQRNSNLLACIRKRFQNKNLLQFDEPFLCLTFSNTNTHSFTHTLHIQHTFFHLNDSPQFFLKNLVRFAHFMKWKKNELLCSKHCV